MNGMSRAGREQQIIEVLESRWMGYSSHALAKKIGLKPSHHVRGILCDMMQRGLICGIEITKTNNRKAWFWYMPNRDEKHGQGKLL